MRVVVTVLVTLVTVHEKTPAGLAMASGTAGARVYLILLGQLFAEREATSGILDRRLPSHVRDFVNRAEVRCRIAMAVETPRHRHGLRFFDGGHRVNSTVAGGATDALAHVNRVVKVDEVRSIVDLFPDDRLVLDEAATHFFQHRAAVPDLRVAVHTQLRGRDTSVRRGLDSLVAKPTIDTFVARVVAMVKLNRLLDRILHATRHGRTDIEVDAAKRTCSPSAHHQQGQAREDVVSGSKRGCHTGCPAYKPV